MYFHRLMQKIFLCSLLTLFPRELCTQQKSISKFTSFSRVIAGYIQPTSILSTLQQLGYCTLTCYKIKPFLEGDMSDYPWTNTNIVDLIARQIVIPAALSYISGHCCNHLFLYALLHNKLSLAQALLDAKFIDPNKIRTTPTLGIVPQAIAFCIPLHIAAAEGHLEMVRLLLAHGAQLSQTDAKGHTVEYFAAEQRDDTAEMKASKRALHKLLRFYHARRELKIAFSRVIAYHQKIQQEHIECESAQELFDAKNIPQDLTDHVTTFIAKNS